MGFLSAFLTDGGNEYARIGLPAKISGLLLSALSGALFAAALPPVNFSVGGFFCLAPMIMLAAGSRRAWFAGLTGYAWGIGWSFFAFNFLREIDPVIPWLAPWVLALWPACFAAFLPGLWRNTMYGDAGSLSGFEEREAALKSGHSRWRFVLFAVGAAAFYTLVEWSRSRLLTWNDLSVTQWRNLPFIQMARLGGSYLVMFALALCNATLAAWAAAGRRYLWPAAGLLTVAVALPLAAGWLYLHAQESVAVEPNFRPGAVQGDISQRRNATIQEAQEALDIYFELSRTMLSTHPECELLIWPESAVPVAYRGASDVSADFRAKSKMLAVFYRRPLLIGALDFTDPPDPRDAQLTNSALLFGRDGRILAKYDKIHRVPFGEYVPFRKFLPQWVVKRIDMQRDLAPGDDFTPITVKKDVRAGVAICYEGVFGYLTTEFARRGANLLIVLSNDAWYPLSSEPEQHLANAVMRAVETGLPMLRCGNNGGSLAVTPQGRVTQVLELPGDGRPELRRGRGFKQFELYVNPSPEKTFYVLYGHYFIILPAAITLFWFALAAGSFARRQRALLKLAEKLKKE